MPIDLNAVWLNTYRRNYCLKIINQGLSLLSAIMPKSLLGCTINKILCARLTKIRILLRTNDFFFSTFDPRLAQGAPGTRLIIVKNISFISEISTAYVKDLIIYKLSRIHRIDVKMFLISALITGL